MFGQQTQWTWLSIVLVCCVAIETDPTYAQAVNNINSVTVNSDGSVTKQSAISSFDKCGSDQAGKLPQVLSFNFRFAPWADVLKLFAQTVGLTLDLQDVPPGTFNYFDQDEYNPTEALDVLRGFLLQRGYLLVQQNKFLVCVRYDKDKPVPTHFCQTVPITELSKRGSNELVTVVLTLKGLDVAEVAEEVKGMLGPQGNVVAMKMANRLVVTGIVRTLVEIHKLYQGVTVIDEGRMFKSFRLKYVAAVEAESIIRELFGLQLRGGTNVSDRAISRADADSSRRSSSDPKSLLGEGNIRFDGGRRPQSTQARWPITTNPTTSASKIQLAVDERTNTLLVTASVVEMKIVDQAIETIDTNDADAELGRASGLEGPRHVGGTIRTLNLNGRDPGEVIELLQRLWNASESNPIRIVKPSHVSPIREHRMPTRDNLRGGRH